MNTYTDKDYIFIDENGEEYISTPEAYFPIVEIIIVNALIPTVPVIVHFIYKLLA